MKWTLLFISLLGFIACNNRLYKKHTVSTYNDTAQTDQNVQYSKDELVSFLDSIGNLNPNSWTEKLTFMVDSTLNNQIKLNSTLNPKDFEKLKATAKSNVIDLDLAKKVFPLLEVHDNLMVNTENNDFPINFYFFDKKPKQFNEFAISIGYDKGLSWNNDVYFFKSNRVIAKHNVFHRYGLELKHFKNEINETVIYYKVNYGSGSGTWWNQFNFYCYNKDELLPTLTEIENINLQFPWSIRAYFIKSTVLTTNPLQLKFVFNNQFTDSLDNQVDFLNDSTEVNYRFNTNKKVYEPLFTNNKLNKLKLLTYFIADNELLFVNINYNLLKEELNSNDHLKQQAVINYLAELKKYLMNNKNKAELAN